MEGDVESFGECFQVSSLLSEESVSSVHWPPKVIPEGLGDGLGEGRAQSQGWSPRDSEHSGCGNPLPLHPTSGEPQPMPSFLPSGWPCSGKQLWNVDTHVNVVVAEDRTFKHLPCWKISERGWTERGMDPESLKTVFVNPYVLH